MKTIKTIMVVFIIALTSSGLYSQKFESDNYFYDGNKVYIKSNGFGKDMGDKRIIYKLSLDQNPPEEFYRSEFPLKNTTISPDIKYLASMQLHVREKQIRSDYSVPVNNLIIIDVSGNLVKLIDDDVRKFVWSPDGKKIAYITGTYRESKRFKSTGTFLWDIEKRNKTQLNEGSAYIAWNVHDNRIYTLWNRNRFKGVLNYDENGEDERETDFKGIFFSNSGKYYYREGSEGGRNRLFGTSTNREISEQLNNTMMQYVNEYRAAFITSFSPRIRGWLDDEILIIQIGSMLYSYSVEEGTVINTSRGTILGKDSRKKELVLFLDNKVFKERIEQ